MTHRKNAEYQAAFKARRAEQGLKPLTLWTHPDDVAELKRLAQLLQERRERMGKVAQP